MTMTSLVACVGLAVIFAASASPYAVTDSDSICNDVDQSHVMLLQHAMSHRLALDAGEQWVKGDIGLEQTSGRRDVPYLISTENSTLQQFKVLPEVHNSCLSSSKPCAPKIAFMFLTISTLTQPMAWDAFFSKASPGTFSIYVERKERDGDLPLRHHGAIEATPVHTEWCMLFGGMISLLHSAFSDAQNEKFVFLSDDSIPLNSFGNVYASLVQKAPESSSFCGVVDPLPRSCLFGGGWHTQDERAQKAHQWSTLQRGHAELLLTHWQEGFDIYALNAPSIHNGCSDEIVPITALLAGLRAEGFPVAGNFDDLAQWNISNRCPVLAAWPGPANCTTPPRPTDIGLTWSPGQYCSLESGHICDPYIFSNITMQHVRNLMCSDFMFARKVPGDSEVINGTERVALSQVVFSDHWTEAEGGACA